MRISDWSSDVCSSDLLGFDELMALALEQRIDQHRILLGNKGPAYFTGAGKLVVVWVKLFVQDKKARHLRAGKPRIVGQVGVDLVDAIADKLVDRKSVG